MDVEKWVRAMVGIVRTILRKKGVRTDFVKSVGSISRHGCREMGAGNGWTRQHHPHEVGCPYALPEVGWQHQPAWMSRNGCREWLDSSAPSSRSRVSVRTS